MGRNAKPDVDTTTIDGIIGYRLRRTQLRVFARFLERFADMRLTPAEYSVLMLIANNPGRTQSTIAAALGIKRANFVALTEGLAGRGLVDRRLPAHDRRAHALHLTEAGEALVAGIAKTQREFEAELVDELGGPAERDRLLVLLARLGG